MPLLISFLCQFLIGITTSFVMTNEGLDVTTSSWWLVQVLVAMAYVIGAASFSNKE